jgi:hypothetical protein
MVEIITVKPAPDYSGSLNASACAYLKDELFLDELFIL